MQPKVVGFGPSMVDVCAALDDAQYTACHDLLDVDPGGWRLIEQPAQVDHLLKIIGVETPEGLGMTADGISTDSATIAAGSSTLGMLGAMPPHIRTESTLVTTLATHEGNLDHWSSFFSQAVGQLGVEHDVSLVEGKNPIGFVLYHQDDPRGGEKTLAMYPGIAQQLSAYDRLPNINPDLVLIDTYELQRGELSEVLDDIIISCEYPVALSLGNRTLLEDGLRQKVRGYVEGGAIFALCGNEDEYRALYPELSPDQTLPVNFGSHPVGEQVPYALMTRGEKGLDSLWRGRVVRAPAYPMDTKDIINTSGAGDTAMGVFCAGILECTPVERILAKAARRATEVLAKPSSMLIAPN